MAIDQQTISARDVDIDFTFTIGGVTNIYRLTTASNFTANITGNTEDIGAISTDEPIATDNGGTTYDIAFSIQEAEAITIKDAMALASNGLEGGSYVHIRQLVEAAEISVTWHKRRSVPISETKETYLNCTGVEEGDSVERRSSETLKNWRFRARGLERVSV